MKKYAKNYTKIIQCYSESEISDDSNIVVKFFQVNNKVTTLMTKII
jgi:hypothetical protein